MESTVNKATVILSQSFYDRAVKDGVAMPEPVAKQGAKLTFELDHAQYNAVKAQGVAMAGHEDDSNRAQAANIRRGGAAALSALPLLAPPEPVDAPDNGTKAVYDTLYAAFDWFNRDLFGGKLPPVVLVLHRKKNVHGYFRLGMWNRAGSKKDISEIALNPESMGRTPAEVLSTLVHEMVHHQQHTKGKPSKVGHNEEWCKMMEAIDLTPVCAGKRYGRHFSHEIVRDGAYAKSLDAFLSAYPVGKSLSSKRAGVGPKKQDKSKVKHTCGCGVNLWGKLGLNVTCGDCGTAFEAVLYA